MTFKRLKCNELKPLMHQMLKHLGITVIDLSFHNCEFNFTTFCEFLREFPLLESLKLHIILTIDKDVELSVEDKPKFLLFKNFKLKLNAETLNETLEMFGSSSKLQSLSLYDGVLNNEEFNDYLEKYKSSLESLILTRCIINKTCNLHTFDLSDNRCNLPPPKDDKVRCMHYFSILKLREVDTDLLQFFNIDCDERIKGLEINYSFQLKNDVTNYLITQFYENKLQRESSLSENHKINILIIRIDDGVTMIRFIE